MSAVKVRPELEKAARAAAIACELEEFRALLAPIGTGCVGCGCVRVLFTLDDGLVCALCGAKA